MENNVSKATLVLAVQQLLQQQGLPQASYFPAYELLLDDLRWASCLDGGAAARGAARAHSGSCPPRVPAAARCRAPTLGSRRCC